MLMSQAMVDSGALIYCANTLLSIAALTAPPRGKSLKQLCEAVRILIQTGNTSPDPAVLSEGTQPRNVFLADFFATGSRSALVELLRNEAMGVGEQEEVLQLNRVVTDIVGDIITEGVAPQLAE